MVLSLALGACNSKPKHADPAIWHVAGPGGEEAWLFGTIHAAPAPLAWNTPPVAQALDRADEVMVEVANIADDAAVAQAFASLSRTPGLAPVAERVPAARRKTLRDMLAARDIREADLRDVETWAVALTLARPESGSDAGNGVDRAVLASASNKRVVELEGASAQLSIFDRLPEADQRDLLDAVLSDAGALDDEADLVDVWRRGDMARIEAETRTGLLADPELRAALFTDRNRRWMTRIAAEMHEGHRPFVAVGAAHMAGPDGLPALLARAGYTVTRLD
ncbi:uncharacterized protein YbaP (TraB family) [Novosphingobium chloroacetimidivorans]|uniref:Uncharacterized protein YbaP (TraB family) n=1 Tax=Novosphingobium chloroacetimidivorans TaxID=1428314 RepID=A0A7W7K5P1_9SPHN|nr:uncharacterized protein YbaP (TraB family) [Novosphingobium chloroacetimidivorans]